MGNYISNARITKSDEKGATVEATARDEYRASIMAHSIINHHTEHGTILPGNYKATGSGWPIRQVSSEWVYEITFERSTEDGKEGGNG